MNGNQKLWKAINNLSTHIIELRLRMQELERKLETKEDRLIISLTQ